VDHGDVLIERGECAGKGRGGVALHHDGVGIFLLKGEREALKGACGQAVQGLLRLDDVQVMVWLDAEHVVDLIDEEPVLPGQRDRRGQKA
jgi:hypothetical protein